MGRVSYLCVDAAEQALTDAGLLGDESITDGRMGVACGSSSGSTKDIGDVGELLLTGMSRNFSANTYVRMMPHTAATANRKKPRAHTTRTATGWSSAKARGFSCWKNWNTPNGAVR
ncbi:TPA: hypothetical protein ACJCPP_000627 [Neisseria meningitidis]|nr:hypothetical protein [Neisseria meningitidis]